MKNFEALVYSIINSRTKKAIVLLVTFIAFIASLLMFPTNLVLAKMLPAKSDNTFTVYVDASQGSSFKETDSINKCVVDTLKKESEITHMQIYSGMGSPLDYAGLVKGSNMKRGEHLSEIVVNLTDKHHRAESSFMMVHRLRPIIKNGCEKLKKETSIKMVEQPSGPPTFAAVVVELYGDNSDSLRELSLKIQSVLASTKGLVDIDTTQDEIYKRFELRIDKDKVIRSSLGIDQVNQILYLAFEGMPIAVKNSENSPEQISLFLVLSDKTKELSNFSKESLSKKLSSLKLMNKKGMMIPINEIVTITEVDSKPMIMTKNLKQMVNITAETDLVSQVYPLLKARSSLIEVLSKEYNVESTKLFDMKLTDKKTGEVFDLLWDGEMKVSLDTFKELGGAFIAALVLIFLLMVIYYKSFAISGIILLGSFLSIIGVIVGHWIMDIFTTDTFFLTATSLIGFIALMGISSRNSLLLIDFAKSLISDGMEKSKAISVATATRAKPIFLTAAAIILASTLLASDPVFGGLGVALIFGTVVAVVVSLLFVPVLMSNSKAI